MTKLQVLVAAMKQDDLSLAERMNIKTDAVIANQHDRYEISEKLTECGKIKMITTPHRGVGLNRNTALMESDADILLFSDDDMTYYDGTLKGVLDAFEQMPYADVIIFSVDLTKKGEIYERRYLPIKRRRLYNSLKFGTYAIAIRRKCVLKNNLTFNQLFGGGCIYGSGEDSLFIRDCFKAGLKVYSHSYVLGTCAKDSSSWFAGYNEKFVFDKGVWLCAAFPKMKHIIKWYFAPKFAKKTGNSLMRTVKIMNLGISSYPKLATYDQMKHKIK